MPLTDKDENNRVPYQLPMPQDALPEIVVPNAIPEDERLWVKQAENVFFRPLCLNVSQGYWMNLLKVTKAGVLSRHRHPNTVHGFVLKGRWHYLEHDWEANEGSYVFEPPGETHTLVVPDDCEEMITYFQVNGIMYYVDSLREAHRLRGRLHQDRHVPQTFYRRRSGRELHGTIHPVG